MIIYLIDYFLKYVLFFKNIKNKLTIYYNFPNNKQYNRKFVMYVCSIVRSISALNYFFLMSLTIYNLFLVVKQDHMGIID